MAKQPSKTDPNATPLSPDQIKTLFKRFRSANPSIIVKPDGAVYPLPIARAWTAMFNRAKQAKVV